MRTTKQSPVFKVIRSQGPHTAARYRWKERMDAERRGQNGATQAVSRRNAVERVPEQRRDDCREACEEREPIASECAPLRYSEDDRGESSTLNGNTPIQQPLNEDNNRPLPYNDDNDTKPNGGISLAALIVMATSTSVDQTASQLAAQGTGDVSSVDQRFRAMSVVAQQERRRAQRALKQEKSVATRRRVLMNILGMKRFYKTLSLVREIKCIREKLLLQWATNVEAKKVVCKIKFDSLPKSGRDLMARTHLVAAVEQTEIERLAKLPWEELILQAQKSVNSYREWVSISETRE